MSLTPLDLMDDLKSLLVDATKNMSLGDSKKSPGVYIGWLPKKKAPEPNSPIDPAVPVVIQGVKAAPKDNQVLEPESDEDDRFFPFIAIQPGEMIDEEHDSNSQTQATIPVKFILGTKSMSEDGFRDVMHLAQVVRQTLIETGRVGAAAELQRPVRTLFYDQQPYPQWLCEINTTWSLPTLTRKVDFLNGYSR